MKIAIVTGASSGIGHHVCDFLAKENYYIHGIDIVTPASQNCHNFQKLDCANYKKVQRFFKTLKKVDVAVNCAGILCVRKNILELDENDLLEAFYSNFLSTFNMVKEEIQIMRKVKGGKIINISSILGHIGVKNSITYAASKASIVALTRTAAAENVEHGIHINSISPASINTPLIANKNKNNPKDYSKIYPIGHQGTTSDVVSVVQMLINNNFMTGSDIVLDGGLCNIFNL
ncbi:MAG: SDR family oxidoreductase [Rickettsiales bacterium]|nr:SDR family oxidoreductase [Silvanigrellaceae bacterium]MBY0580385.1 SDR family oxidoreductase [Rickettsiales bacterium]